MRSAAVVDPLRWYLQRLRMMSPVEVLQRAGAAALEPVLRLERWFRFPRERRVEWRRFAFCGARDPVLPRLPMAFEPSGEETDRLLSADWGALGYPWRWSSDTQVWHRAPDTGRLWPAGFCGGIAYRAGNAYGDARAVWEPARLQNLVSLGLLAQRSPRHRPAAVATLEAVLGSFVDSNPYLTGVHYVSVMECALRLIAVCHALDLVRRDLGNPDASWPALLWLVDSHATLISRRLSRHSSAGNHTIAECAGLVYAGVLFPEYPEAPRWRAEGLRVLTLEASRQVLADGGGLEQAFWYHLFVLDLLGLVVELLRSRDQGIPPELDAAVIRGRKFLSAFGDDPGSLPAIGDADGGFALGRHLRLSFQAPSRSADPILRSYPDAGYTVWQPARAPALRIILDHGPLGMRPACGHGHADALSLLLWHEGEEVLIDPGTHSYNGGYSWRAYFRGTRAHNTLTVDGLDQAEQQGAFLWSRPYNALLLSSSNDCMVMQHDGYRRLGVVHTRSVSIKSGGAVEVLDRVDGHGEHDLELNWHLGADPLAVHVEHGRVELPRGRSLRVSGGECTVHRGEADPLAGWRSRTYGRLEPATTVRVRRRAVLPHQFTTSIRLGP